VSIVGGGGTISTTGSSGKPLDGTGLLNVDQHLGHRRFPRKLSRFNHFLDQASWLLLAPQAPLGKLAGTIVDTLGWR
jgi:hypothetical protein